MSRTSYPLVGAYGFRLQLTVEAKMQATDLDFITFQESIARVDDYLELTTVEIENLAVVNHDVDTRRLGTVGIVLDETVKATATAVSMNITNTPYGTVKMEFSEADYTALGAVIGDRVIVQDQDVFAQTVGEITEVIGTGSNYIEFVGREKTATATSAYVDTSVTWIVRRVEAWWPNCVYRGTRYPRARTLAEAGFRGAGLEYLFETEENMVRRTGAAFVPASASGPLYGSFRVAGRGVTYLNGGSTQSESTGYGGGR